MLHSYIRCVENSFLICALIFHAALPNRSQYLCRRHATDSGSPEVQIAKLTARVRHLTKHLQANRKDYASTRGLMQILSTRKSLLVYLYRKDKAAFANCVRTLEIRNPIKTLIMK